MHGCSGVSPSLELLEMLSSAVRATCSGDTAAEGRGISHATKYESLSAGGSIQAIVASRLHGWRKRSPAKIVANGDANMYVQRRQQML